MAPKLPFGLTKKPDWKSVAAEFVKRLRDAADTAEDLADRVKRLYPNDYASTDSTRAAYDVARHAYNNLSTSVRTLLILGINAPDSELDESDAKAKLDRFGTEAVTLIAAKQKTKIAALPTFAGGVPSVGDITKVFDSIMEAIEWFKTRNDKERHELADVLEEYELRTWAEAGTPRKRPVAGAVAPNDGGAKKKKG